MDFFLLEKICLCRNHTTSTESEIFSSEWCHWTIIHFAQNCVQSYFFYQKLCTFLSTDIAQSISIAQICIAPNICVVFVREKKNLVSLSKCHPLGVTLGMCCVHIKMIVLPAACQKLALPHRFVCQIVVSNGSFVCRAQHIFHRMAYGMMRIFNAK